MKITISSPKKNCNFTIRVPLMVFCNRFVARTLFKAGAQRGHPLSSIPAPVLMQDLSFLKQELVKAKKRFPHLLLVDVQSAQGDVVKIEL